MNRGFTNLVGLSAAFLLTWTVIGNSSASAAESESSSGVQDAEIKVTLIVPATTAEETTEETTKESCESTATKQAVPKKRSGGLFSIFFGSSDQKAERPVTEEADADFQATHQQVALLKVTPDTGANPAADGKSAKAKIASKWGVKSFCLDSEDNLVVAVGDTQGQLQVLSPEGDRLRSLSLPVVPEAVNVDDEGYYLVAGAGEIFKLDSQGEIVLRAKSPIVAQMEENRDEMRRQVIAQMKSSAKSMALQRDRYQKMVDSTLTKAARQLEPGERDEYTLLKKRVEKHSKSDSSQLTAEEQNAWALRKVLLRMLSAKVEANASEQDTRMLSLYRQQLSSIDKYLEQNADKEPTEEAIESSLASMMAYKSRVASISAIGGEVFVATGSAKGYGFSVWRFDENMENPEEIVTQLRGCCGQMDVQCCDSGLFVAENSGHKVRHFDREGEKINSWGKGAREGVRGFGSCCNPMNVAFGPDGSVYTAESGSGRIKRFSTEGELLELVGSVELVPGCKKVSIAVSKDNARVYMLDITRNHIIVMEPKPVEDTIASK